MIIKKYKDYGVINEKISLSRFVLYASLGFTLLNIREVSSMRNLYNNINNPSSLPDQREKILLDSIRTDIIDIISKSNEFNKFGKEYVLDSLRNIEFRVVDESKMANPRAVGVFIDVDNLHKSISYSYFLKRPQQNNIIIIRREKLKEPDLPETVVHELYHYLEKLYTEISKIEEIDIIDPNIDDRKYITNKFCRLFLDKKYEDVRSPDDISFINDVMAEFYKKKGYVTSNTEMFSRIRTFKYRLLKDGVITNIDQKISYGDIIDYIYTSKDDINDDLSGDDILLLLSLDLSKIDQI